MEIEIALPLDNDGFLRRECPSCERQFKWFHGHTADRPDHYLDPPLYTCPTAAKPRGMTPGGRKSNWSSPKARLRDRSWTPWPTNSRTPSERHEGSDLSRHEAVARTLPCLSRNQTT